MSLTCLDILNIHVRLPHWSKSWYLWHAANIWCLLVSLWKQCPLLSATWPPPMWFYWTRLIRERRPQHAVRWQTPRCLALLFSWNWWGSWDQVRFQKPPNVRQCFTVFARNWHRLCFSQRWRSIQAVSLCVQPERQKNKKPYFLKLLDYSLRAASINDHKTGAFKQLICILS